MDIQPYIIRTFNTFTNQYEDTEVSKEVYDLLRRTAWNWKDSTERFYAHEIQFSSLIGGEDNGYDNFHEFISNDSNPETIACKNAELDCVAELIRQSSLDDQKLLDALFERGVNVKQYAAEINEARSTISSRKQRILRNFKKNSIFKK